MYLKPLLIAHLIGIIVYAHPMQASQTVHNQTNFPLYMATYVTGDNAQRQSGVITIGKHASATIDVPSMEFFSGKRRYIAVSNDKEDLKENPDIQFLRGLTRFDISSRWFGLVGGTYYVVDKEGRLAIYSDSAYSNMVKFIGARTKNIKQEFSERLIDEKRILAIHDTPHRSQVAWVRTGNELSPEERDYRAKREPKIRRALKKLLPNTTDNAPRMPVISVALSGGGNRAMFSSCGFMHGLEEIGILDATTYVAALSGSTWFLGSWFASNMPEIANFRKKLIQTMKNGLSLDLAHEYALMLDEFKSKYIYQQPITSIDLLGALLGNALFRTYDDKRYHIYLSDQKKNVETSDWPFPIYTVVDGSGVSHPLENWYEFTPYEVGGAWLNAYIPTWAFGRKFAQGKSVDNAPETPLAFLFGIFGSAPSVDYLRAWQEIEQVISLNERIKKIVQTHILNPLGHKRLTYGEEFNFTAGIQKSPLRNQKYMKLVDGGYGHNLPYPVVSGEREERTPDILIFFDASGNVTDFKTKIDVAAKQLHSAEKYARSHNLKFPHITKVLPRMINIYKDETDPSVPVVMWIPCTFDAKKYTTVVRYDTRFMMIKDFDFRNCINTFCSTINFKYTPAEADKLIVLGQFCAHACQHEIIEEIAWKMEHMTP